MPRRSACRPGGSRPRDGLRGALKEALAANAPALIEVMSDIAKETAPWGFIAPNRG